MKQERVQKWEKAMSSSDENITYGNIKKMMKAAVSFPYGTLCLGFLKNAINRKEEQWRQGRGC